MIKSIGYYSFRYIFKLPVIFLFYDSLLQHRYLTRIVIIRIILFLDFRFQFDSGSVYFGPTGKVSQNLDLNLPNLLVHYKQS